MLYKIYALYISYPPVPPFDASRHSLRSCYSSKMQNSKLKRQIINHMLWKCYKNKMSQRPSGGNEMRATVVDVETTGLDAERDRVVEVGVIWTDWDVIYAALETTIRPPALYERPWSDKSPLRPTDVEHSPGFAHIAPFLFNLLAWSDEIVAYNAPFDMRFLSNELLRCNLWMPDRRICDPMRVGGRITLKEACSRNKLFFKEDYPWHRAMGDASATFRLWQRLRLRETALEEDGPVGGFVPG